MSCHTNFFDSSHGVVDKRLSVTKKFNVTTCKTTGDGSSEVVVLKKFSAGDRQTPRVWRVFDLTV